MAARNAKRPLSTSYGKIEDYEQCSLKKSKGLVIGLTCKCTSTSSWELRVECEPMTNKVGVFSSKRGSSTPCQKWTMLIWSISFSFLVQSKQTVGSLRRHDSNGGENWAFFEPWCDYPNTLYLSNVSELSWSWKSWEKYPSSKRERENRLCLFTISIQREIRHFHVVVAQWRQRNVRKSVP